MDRLKAKKKIRTYTTLVRFWWFAIHHLVTNVAGQHSRVPYSYFFTPNGCKTNEIYKSWAHLLELNVFDVETRCPNAKRSPDKFHFRPVVVTDSQGHPSGIRPQFCKQRTIRLEILQLSKKTFINGYTFGGVSISIPTILCRHNWFKNSTF